MDSIIVNQEEEIIKANDQWLDVWNTMNAIGIDLNSLKDLYQTKINLKINEQLDNYDEGLKESIKSSIEFEEQLIR